MRKLAVIVLLLALFGASTQCVADCLTQTLHKSPPCHKDPAPEPCNHSQLAVLDQAICPQAIETPAPTEVAFEPFIPETPRSATANYSSSILRI